MGAMTRASQLVYIVGDGYTLRNNSHWSQLLQYCSRRGSIIGDPFDLNSEQKFEILPPRKGQPAPPLDSINHYPQLTPAPASLNQKKKKKKKQQKTRKQKENPESKNK